MTTLAQAQSMVTAHLTAIEAILNGQAFTFNGRSVTLANLKDVQEGLAQWERRLASLSGKTKTRKAFLTGRTV